MITSGQGQFRAHLSASQTEVPGLDCTKGHRLHRGGREGCERDLREVTFCLEAGGINLRLGDGCSPSDWEFGLLYQLTCFRPPRRRQVRMEGPWGPQGAGLAAADKKTGKRAGGEAVITGHLLLIR